jgi:8-oxoguanine deaminase
MFRADDVALAGAVAHDPLAALIFCAAGRADHVFVDGRQVVQEGRLTRLDETALAVELNELVSSQNW